MYLFVLILLCLACVFPKIVNSTDIVNTINSTDCGLLSDNLMNELKIKETLCSVQPSKLQDLIRVTEYDVLPLLCTQLYEVNRKICEYVRNGSSEKVNFTNGMKDFVKDVKNKNMSVNSFCNSTKSWVEDKSSNVSNTNESISNYFRKLMENNCQQICSSRIDGSLTDLCILTVGAQELYKNATLHSKSVDGVISKQKTASDMPIKKTEAFTNKNKAVANNDENNFQTEIGDEMKAAPPNTSQNLPLQPIDTVATQDVVDTRQQIGESLSKPRAEANHDKDEGTLNNEGNGNIPRNDVQLTKAKQLNIENEAVGQSNPQQSVSLEANPVENDGRGDNPLEISDNRGDNVEKNFLPQGESENDNQDFLDPVQENIKGQENEMKQDGLGDSQDILLSAKVEKPLEQQDISGAFRRDHLMDDEDSHFFTYFVCMGVACGVLYILFHNKKKILALAVEGRRGRNHSGGRRRPNTASYSKLDSNLEEAMVSNVSQASVTHVLY